MEEYTVDGVTSIEGPVEMLNGELVLLILLVEGGQQLIECSRGISEIDGDNLKVIVRPWLADMLGLEEGVRVWIDNRNGKFNLRRATTSS
jgi:hypothetical protein